MAHFAQLDDDNQVIQVLVIANEDTADEQGNEVEAIGIEFCENLFGGGTWIQTSYNHNIRKQFAGIGDNYDPDVDKFIKAQPYPSWSLDDNHDWQPPTPMPDGNTWYWDEDSVSWLEPSVDE